MGCLSPELYKQYPNCAVVILTSTVDKNGGQEFSPLHVSDNVLGYHDELEKAGQHATGPGSASGAENPYPTALRPNTDAETLKALKGTPAIVESMTFYALDTTEQTPTQLQEDGVTTYQDPTVSAAIIASQSTVMDANVASRFRNAIVANWQPNWFRPSVIINGVDLLNGISRSNLPGSSGAKDHKGDLSIGLPLPFNLDLGREFPNGIQSIEVNAQVVQYIKQAGSARKFVRYPVVCILIIRHQ